MVYYKSLKLAIDLHIILQVVGVSSCGVSCGPTYYTLKSLEVVMDLHML